MVSEIKYRYDFIGLSTDTKPTPATSNEVVDGSTFYASDTSKLYVWYDNQWYEKADAGGTTYTAGTGIDITDNTISVDTDTVQPKLTAGEGIDITDNTISATGGASPTVVQTTGTSTTDVMSQKAVTDTLFADGATGHSVRIGNTNTNGTNSVNIGYNAKSAPLNTVAIGNGAGADTSSSTLNSVMIGAFSNLGSGAYCVALGANSYAGSYRDTAIGYKANATYQYSDSVALGSNSKTTRSNEVNIGFASDSGMTGFNNDYCRVLGGVSDGQLAHDAVTVGQVNSVIDAINTALSTNIPHIGA